MGHDGVASGYTTPTGFHRLMCYQRDPRIWGVTMTFLCKMDCFQEKTWKIFYFILKSNILNRGRG